MLAQSVRHTAEELSPAQRALYGGIPDPTGKPALCRAEDLPAFLTDWVADSAPRLFAIVQEYGERVDLRIAAWGIAFEDSADVLDARGGGLFLGIKRPEIALPWFCHGPHVAAHLVWFDASAVTVHEEYDDEPGGA